MAALHLLWTGERLSAPPPDERQIAHQVPDPTEALTLMTSAIRALLCTTHLLDRAVRSTLGANGRNWRGSSLRTFPEHSLCSLPGRVVDPAFSRDHFSLADLRETSHPHGTHLGVVWRHQFGGSFWPAEGSSPSAARATLLPRAS